MTPRCAPPARLASPRRIIIFRGPSSWLADIPDWNVEGAPLPFRECASALQVQEHLARLHPAARIVVEEAA